MAASRDVASHALRASLLAMLAATAQAAPVAQPSRSVVEFGFISPGIASPPQPVFVTNTGDAPLAISALAKSGPQADDFTLGGTCSVPASLEERCCKPADARLPRNRQIRADHDGWHARSR